jgi:hypothetical protein
MLGSIPAATSALESNPEGVVLLLLFKTVYVACMFFVFCWPLVFAALGSTSFSSLTLDAALLLPLNKSISPSEAPPTLFSAFKNTLICARCSSITFKYACERAARERVFKHRVCCQSQTVIPASACQQPQASLAPPRCYRHRNQHLVAAAPVFPFEKCARAVPHFFSSARVRFFCCR